ncbi:MAG: hypothetical protein ACK5UX_10105 [Burkholderiales bacterium]
MTKFVIAVLASAFVAFSANAEVVRFTKGPGTSWSVGDKSQMYMTQDGKVGIQMIVKQSQNTGRYYYVVGFQTRGGPIKFSARVTDREPDKAHFTGRIEPGKTFTWGEHLPAGLNAVYVIYKPSN